MDYMAARREMDRLHGQTADIVFYLYGQLSNRRGGHK